jgi:signal transduction histidine kinase
MHGEGGSQSMRRPRFGSRLATTLLIVVFASVLTALGLADRALERFDRAQESRIAQRTAREFGDRLRWSAAASAYRSAVQGDARAADGIVRVWTIDSAGRPAHVVPPWPPETASAWAEASRIGASHARASGDAALAGVAGATRTAHRVVLVARAPGDGATPAFLGAEVAIDTLLHAIAATDPEIFAVRLVAGGDTLRADTLAPSASDRHAIAPAALAADSSWRLVVLLHAGRRRMRASLWVMGIGLLLVLSFAVTHERRQSRRIAERSDDLERLSGDLLRANRVKNEFLAAVSHELRTPLNAIVGFADLLRDGAYGELAPRQISPVQRIEASANHLRLLVDQMLDLAKMAAGRLEVHREILDLRPFALEVVSEMESLVAERGLSLQVSIGTTLPRVRTDPAHLRQILVNLLGNAVKYTTKGTVAVRARVGDAPSSAAIAGAPRGAAAWMAVQVVDTGIGIAPGDRARIFEEFEQVNAGSRGDSMRRGTGLGLPISRRLARLLGGDITLESVPGQGSTFTLWLPIDSADEAAVRV